MITGTTSPRPTAAPSMPADHRAHLDGIRAVAVYLVVVFHAGIGRFAGGHIGVDVFFVLSGYLVTGVLLRSLARADGDPRRLAFGRFYARRARRLLPAALVCLLVTAAAFTALASRGAVLDAADGFRAAALYLTNWYLIDNATDYFATDTSHSPILHFWSLAVEEQFYLVWPLLFAGLVLATQRIGRHRWNVVRAVVVVAIASSFLWAFALRGTDQLRSYYGTDTRAYQLLAGALLALTPSVIARFGRLGRVNDLGAAAAVLGLVLVTVGSARIGPMPRGALATVLTLAAIIGLESGRAPWSARALGAPPVAYLGAISYSTYLWHWPILVLAETVADLTRPQLLVLTVAGATGLASLSHQLLEEPIRSSPRLDRFAWPVAVAGLALSLLAGLVALPRLTEPPDRVVVAATGATEDFTPIPATFDYDEVRRAHIGTAPDCLDRPVSACTVVAGEGTHLLLLGDSTAIMWTPALTDVARRRNLTLSVDALVGCPWQRGLAGSAEDPARCLRLQEDAHRRVVDALDPDVVIVTAAVATTWTDADLAPSTERAIADSIEALRADGRTVVVFEPMPAPRELDVDPLRCLGDAAFVEDCRFVTTEEPLAVEEAYRRADAEDDQVLSLDLDRLICPYLPICDPLIGGTAVFWNRNHLTAGFSERLGPALEDVLDAAGVLR